MYSINEQILMVLVVSCVMGIPNANTNVNKSSGCMYMAFINGF